MLYYYDNIWFVATFAESERAVQHKLRKEDEFQSINMKIQQIEVCLKSSGTIYYYHYIWGILKLFFYYNVLLLGLERCSVGRGQLFELNKCAARRKVVFARESSGRSSHGKATEGCTLGTIGWKGRRITGSNGG